MFLYRPNSTWQKEETEKAVPLSTDPLAVIYNEGSWRVSKISPLYNLRYSTVKLKQYASKVRQAIVSTLPPNSSAYTVLFEEEPTLKYTEEDSSALRISILSTQEKNKSKELYTAIILSWGVYVSLSNATHLPYYLERGEQKLGTIVKATLQSMFDCYIKQYSFTQSQLLHFGFSFLESDTSRGTDSFTLFYQTAQDQTEKLDISFDISDIHYIWNGIQDSAVNKSEQEYLAYTILQNQILHTIMLDINVLDLCSISLPKSEVKSNGIVKMKTPEMVNCVFLVLNDICNDSESISMTDETGRE